jgi:hypothetical protein
MMIRDKETDSLLIHLRALFNQGKYAEVRQHALLMSDWLDDRGRHAAAAALRSGRWKVLVVSGTGWPPLTLIVDGDCRSDEGALYMDSDWLTSAELLGQIADSPDAGEQGKALLKLMAHAIDEVGLVGDQTDGPADQGDGPDTTEGGAS